MSAINQLLLTFLLNTCWQIALVAAIASLCGWLIRGTATRYQHWLCVTALVLSIGLPLLSCSLVIRDEFLAAAASIPVTIGGIAENAPVVEERPAGPASLVPGNSLLTVNRTLALTLLAVYLAFIAYRIARLLRAWRGTRRLKFGTRVVEFSALAETIIQECKSALGISAVRIVCSDTVPVPMTIGFINPLVILPEKLLHETDADLLRSAVGHELVHVRRRDYLFNLIYEFIYLPLSFHPAAALVRRRINQTRELVCDDLVAEHLLDAKVYARSLVRLITSAAPLGRPAITVGISDADILEVRIMSLIGKTKLRSPGNKLLLTTVAVILAIPCVAAASLALRFKIDPQRTFAQEPSPAEKEARQKREREEREVQERQDQELKEALAKETDPERRAKLEALLKRRQEERANEGYSVTVQGNPYELKVRRAQEDSQKKAQQAELASHANVTMDRAIQIATSQTPGKVLECNLIGEHWEAPGRLGKDSLVLYHVVILTSGDTGPTTVHVLVNASDGTIFKSNKEERR